MSEKTRNTVDKIESQEKMIQKLYTTWREEGIIKQRREID
jgi:hypothetical protein